MTTCRTCHRIVHDVGAHYCRACLRQSQVCTWEIVAAMLVMLGIAILERYCGGWHG